MSHIHLGQLTASKEWAKHLRPWGKRAFWKGERQAGQAEAWAQRLVCSGSAS